MAVNERVQIYYELIDGTQVAGKSIVTNIKNLNNGLVQTTKSVWDLSNGQSTLAKQTASTQKAVTKFRGEWLSVMFLGMAIDRVFGGVVKSSMGLWGVTNLLSSAWKITMIPIMSKITGPLYDLIFGFMKLPKPVQLVIGAFMIFMTIIGKLLAAFGATALGIWGLAQTFGISTQVLMSTVYKFIGGIIGSIGLVVGVIAAIIAVIWGMYTAWKENFLGMRDIIQGFVNGVKQIVTGFINIFKGLWSIVVGIFTLDGTKILDGFKKVFYGIGDILAGLVKSIVFGIGSIAVGAFKVVVDLVMGLINWIGGIPKLWGGKALFKIDATKEINKLLNIPSYKTGGVIPATGPYLLHQGETVVPANQSSSGGGTNITINASVASDYDVRRLAQELNKYLVNNYQNSTGRK